MSIYYIHILRELPFIVHFTCLWPYQDLQFSSGKRSHPKVSSVPSSQSFLLSHTCSSPMQKPLLHRQPACLSTVRHFTEVSSLQSLASLKEVTGKQALLFGHLTCCLPCQDVQLVSAKGYYILRHHWSIKLRYVEGKENNITWI